MKEFMFKIEKNDKPIINVRHSNGLSTSCLIDTGANMPIWFIGEQYLLFRFPNALPSDNKTILTGIGRAPIMDVPIWTIPEFTLTDDTDEKLIYNNLLIAVIEMKRFSFDMIIPLTMINRMTFSFDYISSADNALFKINAAKGKYYSMPFYAKTNREYINRIQVFASE